MKVTNNCFGPTLITSPFFRLVSITSGGGMGVSVTVGVVDGVGVSVIVGVRVSVAVGVNVGVDEGVGVSVSVGVNDGVVDGVGDSVLVGVKVKVAVSDGVWVMVGVAVLVPVRVIVGVGVAQNAVALVSSTPRLSRMTTLKLPYNPLMVNWVVLPGVAFAVNVKGPEVRKTAFW